MAKLNRRQNFVGGAYGNGIVEEFHSILEKSDLICALYQNFVTRADGSRILQELHSQKQPASPIHFYFPFSFPAEETKLIIVIDIDFCKKFPHFARWHISWQ